MSLLDGVVGSIKSSIGSYAVNQVSSLFSNVSYLQGFGLNFLNNSNVFDINFIDQEQSIFESKVGDLSFKNRFDFIFVLPSMMKTNSEYDLQDLIRIYCRQFPIPSTNLEVSEMNILNKKITGTIKVNFDTINVTFFDNKALTLHKFFHRWMHERWDLQKGTIKYYPNDYKTEVMVTNYKEKVYHMKGLHPISVGDIVFTHDSMDEILTFDVTFSVDDLIPYATTSNTLATDILFPSFLSQIFGGLGNNILGGLTSYFNGRLNNFLSSTTSSVTSKLGSIF